MLTGVSHQVTHSFDGSPPSIPFFIEPSDLDAFVNDAAWSGQKFWMINAINFKDGSHGTCSDKYNAYTDVIQNEVLSGFGAKLIFSGYALTFIGVKEYHKVMIHEYPSPLVFKHIYDFMSGARTAFIAALVMEQCLIPIKPGWYHLERPAPAPSENFKRYELGAASGLVEESQSAIVGHTSATAAQAEAFMNDKQFGSDRIWNLNLLSFKKDGGKDEYNKYAKAQGGKSGLLSRFGARSTLSSACYKTLMGNDVHFDQAIIAEYPSRESCLSMSMHEEYLSVAHHRHKALEATYIIGCKPEFIGRWPE